MNLNELTIKQAQAGLKKREFTSVELTKACLDQIKERNTAINAFVTVCKELALAEAKKADKIISTGKQQELTGIPFAVKDAICTANVRSTGSAKILDNYIPPFDATVIKKIRDQGAVLVGKNNCDSFGHGASNENSMYGPVKNPHDLSKVAGGSSGGSAAAVADNMCIFAIGEDTGGSIRLPSSFCGIVGLRPSYGRNSRFGSMPMASSLDTVGPMTKTVEDCAIVEQIIAGQDKKDATTVSDVVSDYLAEINQDIKDLKIGIPKEYFALAGLDEEVKELTYLQISKLSQLGCEIIDVSLPYTKYAVAVYYIVVACEDSSNLARLDGIRYGNRIESDNLYDLYAKTRDLGFPEEVKRRIMIGTYALSAGYYDAYYKKAQTVRTLIRKDFDNVFKQVDVLLTPTVPFSAFDIGGKIDDVLAMYLCDAMELPASVSGMPAISVPSGQTKNGLPVGVQLIGPRMGEGKLFQIGNKLI